MFYCFDINGDFLQALSSGIALEISDNNMCTEIVYFPGFDVINSEINLIFLIKPFFYMTRKSKQKFKYLENKESF